MATTTRRAAGSTWIVAALASLGVAGAVLLLASATPAWIALLVLGGATAVAAAWSRSLKRFLLCAWAATATVFVTKALSSQPGVYGPALEISVSDFFLIALLPCWLVARARRPLPVPGAKLLALYVGWYWLSALHSSDAAQGLMRALGDTRILLIFLMVATLVDSAVELRTLLAALATGVALQSAMALAQFATGSELAIQGSKLSTIGTRLVYEGAGAVSAFRPSGFMLHPNLLASLLVQCLPVLAALLLLGPARLPRRLWWGCLALAGLAGAALLVTLSRGGWIAAVVGCAMTLWLLVRRGLVARRTALGAVCGAALLAVAIVVVYPQAWYRLTQSDSFSSRSRLLLMDQGWLIVQQHWLLGTGLAGYTDAAAQQQPASFALISDAYREVLLAGIVHVKYVLIWAENGLVGLLLLLGLYFGFLRRGLALRAPGDAPLEALSVGLCAGLVGQLTLYLFDHYYQDHRTPVIWVAAALLVCLPRLVRRPA